MFKFQKKLLLFEYNQTNFCKYFDRFYYFWGLFDTSFLTVLQQVNKKYEKL